MITLFRITGTPPVTERIRSFRSYRDIGKYLSKHGRTGTYHAVPRGIKSIAGIKEITVVRYTKDDISIDMDGSYY